MAGRLKKILSEGFREIVYVSIGILLALQINNRNDVRKGKRELNNIISIVKQDLAYNVADAKENLKVIKLKTNYLETIFDSSLSEDSVKNCKTCFAINTSFRDLTIRDRGLTMLRSFKANNYTASDSTIIDIDAFYAIYTRTNATMVDLLNDDAIGTLNYYRDHFDWYQQFINGQISEQMIDDILNNTVTRNRLLHHKILLDGNYGSLLRSFVFEGEALIKELNTMSND